MPRGQKDAAFYDSAALLVLSLLRRRTRPVFSCCMRWNAAQTARLPSAKAACIPCCTDLRHAAMSAPVNGRPRTARTVFTG